MIERFHVYEQRLIDLNLHTLAFKRTREQLLQVFKLMHYRYDAEYRNFFQREPSLTPLEETLKDRSHLSRIRSCFFTLDIKRSWNSVPEEIINSVTLDSFKSAVGNHLRVEWFHY